MNPQQPASISSPGAVRVAWLLPDLGIPLFSSVKAGGVHARSMIRAFADEGATVDVFAVRLGKPSTFLGDSITLHPVAESAMRRRWTRWYRHSAMPLWATGVEALLAQREVVRSVRGFLPSGPPPDLIYARHAWLGFAAPRLHALTRAPLYLEINALFAREKADRGELAWPGLTRRIESRVLRSATRLLPISGSIAEDLERAGLPSSRITVMPNAVDPGLFDSRVRESAPPATPGRFRIALVSSFRPYHGLTTLLEAARLLKSEMPGLSLRLIGDGPERARVEALARELGIADRVEVTGGVPHDTVPALLAECDAGVAPFQGDFNRYNCPMKLYEYMAMKLPIVASDWGEIPRIVGHGRFALLHESGSAPSLAACLRQIWAGPEAAVARAEAAHSFVLGHTWRAHARSILDEVARGRSGE